MGPVEGVFVLDRLDKIERQLSVLRMWIIFGNVFAVAALLLSCAGVGLVMSRLFVATGPAPVMFAGGAVPAVGEPVTENTPLNGGMMVLVLWENGWWNAKVLALLADGRVKIHYTGWDAAFDEVVSRDRLRLPSKPGPDDK